MWVSVAPRRDRPTLPRGRRLWFTETHWKRLKMSRTPHRQLPKQNTSKSRRSSRRPALKLETLEVRRVMDVHGLAALGSLAPAATLPAEVAVETPSHRALTRLVGNAGPAAQPTLSPLQDILSPRGVPDVDLHIADPDPLAPVPAGPVDQVIRYTPIGELLPRVGSTNFPNRRRSGDR